MTVLIYFLNKILCLCCARKAALDDHQRNAAAFVMACRGVSSLQVLQHKRGGIRGHSSSAVGIALAGRTGLKV